MMENIDVNTVFLDVATAMAGFSVLLVWIYLFEVARGIDSLYFYCVQKLCESNLLDFLHQYAFSVDVCCWSQ